MFHNVEIIIMHTITVNIIEVFYAIALGNVLLEVVMDFKRDLPGSLCIKYPRLYLYIELSQQELIQLPHFAEAIQLK